MLSLIFSRAKKRNLIGLLALGEWGPPTGAPVAITGSGSTQQAGQQDLVNGNVANPAHIGSGGGFGAGAESPTEIPAIAGRVRTRQAAQQSEGYGELEFIGHAVSAQADQSAILTGDVIPAIFGECTTGQRTQHSGATAALEFSGHVLSSPRSPETVAIGHEVFVGIVSSGHGIGIPHLEAQLQFVGQASGAQSLQESVLVGDMFDTELEAFLALMMEAA